MNLKSGNSPLQINNSKAYRLLEDVEDLKIIKVLQKSVRPRQKLSEKYAGKLSSKVADRLQDFVTQDRNEWSYRLRFISFYF